MADLVPQRSKKAIHYLRPTEVDSPLYGKMQTNTVACGQPLDSAGWTNRVATEPHRVTCRTCHALAHPKRSPYATEP